MTVKTHTAIQGVCAWPNLTVSRTDRSPDGTIVAAIFNQPCHGMWEGDLDCWASEDDGHTWQFRGRPAAHAPGTNRMNCAAGLAANGDMIVLCSGWTNRGPVGQPTGHGAPAKCLRPWICRSADGARTWKVDDSFPDNDGAWPFIPFGDILPGADGSLCASAYARKDNEKSYSAYFMRSRDDGHSWGETVELDPLGNETAILPLGEGKWLAASRQEAGRHIELLSSDDDGQSWVRQMPLTLPGQVTGHLARLRDGRILLSYGNRCLNNWGVDGRFSEDDGGTWGAPIRIADTPTGDCGYPSSVQLADGRVLTAFYTQLSGQFHYEMRVSLWDPNDPAG